jgi:outer membrane lipoprotein-sorting protein
MEHKPVASVITAWFGLAVLAQNAFAAPSADDVMARNLLATKVADSTTKSTFRMINASGKERVRETDGDSKLIAGTTDNRRLVNFLSPADIRGTKTLLIEHSNAEDDIWIYLPAMKKVRRLVASNKKDSFVGTDFSYGDVIGYKVEEWNHKLVREENVAGRDCYVIESTPKSPQIAANTGYSKRIGWVDKESFVALRIEIYDLGGELLKKLSAENVQKVDSINNRYQPMKLTAENVQTGHKTIIEFKDFKANVGIDDDAFTARTLDQ